jgi:G3E family GTPase
MISLTIITGWLGAGKTTLLNRILEESRGLRIVVVQNEFGQVGIDADIMSAGAAGVYELSDGCICCGVNDDFMEVIEQLATADAPPDAIIVETTGLADPAATLLSLIANPYADDLFRIDGVVTVADATYRYDDEAAAREAIAQIALADTIILSKLDPMQDVDRDRMMATIRSLNPTAPLIPSSFAHVDVGGLLDIGGFDPQRLRLDLPLDGAAPSGERHHGIAAHTLRSAQPIDRSRLDGWLATLVESEGERLYRIKGIVDIIGEENPIVVQGVRSLYTWRYRSIGADEKRGSRIVVMGEGIDDERLRSGWEEIAGSISA